MPEKQYAPPEVRDVSKEPNGWTELDLPKELDSPWKRFRAVANTIHNGGKSLAVLTMPLDTGTWTSYEAINSTINSKTGRDVILAWTTREHLVRAIEPVGVAAHSTLDDKDWALTKFGVISKAPIIYAWEKLLELGLDGMNVFAHTSHVTRGQNGEIDSTPPEVRAQILLYCFNNNVRYVDLEEPTKTVSGSIRDHLRDLQTHGLIDKKSVSMLAGSVATYKKTDQGELTTSWERRDAEFTYWTKYGIDGCIFLS